MNAGAPGLAPRLNARAALLLLVLIAEAPAACGESPEAERFIQGTWSYSGTVSGDPPHRAIAFQIEWTLDSGTFRQSGYPPLLSEGRYRVVRAAADGITLTLYQQKGNFSEADRTIEIALDKAAGTITIDKGPALRRKSVR